MHSKGTYFPEVHLEGPYFPEVHSERDIILLGAIFFTSGSLFTRDALCARRAHWKKRLCNWLRKAAKGKSLCPRRGLMHYEIEET